MAWNPFIGKTEPELLELRTQLQDALANTLMGATSGSVSSQNLTQSADIQRRLEWVFKALTAIDAERYPASQYERRSRVGVSFTTSNY